MKEEHSTECFFFITENRKRGSGYLLKLFVKSNRFLTGIFRILEIALQLPMDVLIIPRSILLIWEISTPISLASCAWVNPCSFLTFLRFLPNAIRNSFSSKFSTC